MIKISKKFNFCFILTMFLFLFYYSYRYILQYNSTTTSPYYSDTPLVLKALKYVLLVVLMFSLSIFIFINKKRLNQGNIKYLLLILVGYSFYIFVICQSSNSAIFFLLLLLIALIFFSNKYVDEDKLDKLLTLYLYFSILYEAVQIFLYFYIGRMPALAYETGSMSTIRFGGAIDDPNGFGVFLCLLIPFVFKKYKGIKRIILVSILLLFLLLTWSLTAIASFAGFLVLYELVVLIKYSKVKKENKYIISFIILAIIGLFVINAKTNFISKVFVQKAISISDHMSSFDEIGNLSALTIIGILPTEIIVEAGVVRLLGYGGPLLLFLFYMFGIYAGYCAFALTKKIKKYNYIYFSFAFYIFTVLIGTINLPMIDSFFSFGVYSLVVAA